MQESTSLNGSVSTKKENYFVWLFNQLKGWPIQK